MDPGIDWSRPRLAFHRHLRQQHRDEPIAWYLERDPDQPASCVRNGSPPAEVDVSEGRRGAPPS
jgi:hypothetical protein